MKQKTPIAVVGMAGLFPGASDLDTFWRNIINKVDTACEVPKDRWIVEPDSIYNSNPMPDKALSKRACLIRDFKFDSKGINLDPNLLKKLDPLYHIVLHVGRKAFSDCKTSSLDKKRVGVSLAAIALPTDASSAVTREILGRSFASKLETRNSKLETRNSKLETGITREECLSSRVTSLPGAILARALGLRGGSFTLDAACASSLYAVKLACDELLAGRADAMLAGGVSRPECLYTQVGFSQLRAISPSGRCAPFDESADGLVVGEGAGIIVLKRLDDALRDGDTVYGLIRGIGLSNDMRGNLLAPETKGQVRAMRSAYESAGWSPYDVDIIECHGAGTRVGDLTELHSLKTLWGESGWSPAQCAIGSVKSMVGHLLTGAGAAGMIKILLALKHKTLPPSLNFKKAPEGSPLNNSPFRVQTRAQEWTRRDTKTPLRAGVSAFGFGGINAHLLFEEFETRNLKLETRKQLPEFQVSSFKFQVSSFKFPTVAIVGMDAAFGSLTCLRDFQEAIFKGESAIRERPGNRWRGCDEIAETLLEGRGRYGAYMDDVSLYIGEFNIPPNEIPDILPQQLLMLKVSARAMKDAGLPLREERPRMGTVIGMEFDFEATNFHQRWNLYNEVQTWKKKLRIDDEEADAWLESLRDSFHPPLTSARTVGALGGIVASRIAREFRFGGPSFVVSGGSASGIRALEIGVRSLQQNETDAVLIGAIDLAGDVRNILTTNTLRPFTKKDEIRPFDPAADGTLPGEGAAAIIIKRLDQAIQDGDRIYSVIRGIGNAGAGDFQIENSQASFKEAYTLSLDRAFHDSDVSPDAVSYIETHGSADPLEDKIESEALQKFFSHQKTPCAIGAVKPNIGHTGASAGLASLVKTSLCLYQETIPPIRNSKLETRNSKLETRNSKLETRNSKLETRNSKLETRNSKLETRNSKLETRNSKLETRNSKLETRNSKLETRNSKLEDSSSFKFQVSSFHIPAFPQFWLRDRKDGPRRACVGAMTWDGNCSHVILENFEYESLGHIPEKVTRERKQPSGLKSSGLFIVEGNDKNELLNGLDALKFQVSSFKFQVSSFKFQVSSFELAARAWYLSHKPENLKKYALSIVASDFSQLEKWITEAKHAVLSDIPKKITGPEGISFSPSPLGSTGEIAFVFPGSGNHYVGMGREIGVLWPEILREMDAQTLQLKTQMIPECYVPWRVSWDSGWEADAHKKIISDPSHMIFGQVVHGGVVANLIKSFDIKPSAVIGYSLGESAGLFAMGAWPERGDMLKRMLNTDLFTTELAGPCHAACKIWNIPPDEQVNWRVAVVNRPASRVQAVIEKWPFARLLIVNTPDECVIGGKEDQIEGVIKTLGCEAIFLEGVVTVHCDAALPAKDAYKALHVFPTTPPEGIRFYSCAMGRSYPLTSENAASSILQQALSGFDFPATIGQAYEDGVRIFLEMGPQASCTRMISRILDTKPHLAISADARGENDYLTILKFLGTLIAERVPVNLDKLYGDKSYVSEISEPQKEKSGRQITVIIGGETENLKFETGNWKLETGNWKLETGNSEAEIQNSEVEAWKSAPETKSPVSNFGFQADSAPETKTRVSSSEFQANPESETKSPVSNFGFQADSAPETKTRVSSFQFQVSSLIEPMTKTIEATSDAHKMFLEFSNELTQNFGKTFALQTQLLSEQLSGNSEQFSEFLSLSTEDQRTSAEYPPLADNDPLLPAPAFPREMCMEFAIGSVGKVLGPDFDIVDTYKARVRLPDEPLMLVDRILSVEGEKGSLGSGRVITEHDVFPDAWYLDGDRTPVCISVEAGQADLFLCSYLGIDLVVKGKRTYRLLDATITFHRGLPRPGDVIRYEIEIEKFVRQGETYLFFFSFEGFIGNDHLITMRKGCAGFFTEEEVRNSGGIILTEEDIRPVPGRKDFNEIVPVYSEAYDDAAVECLRNGNLSGGFGELFDGIQIAESLRLPGGRMRLIDRILLLDPNGGRYGLGFIRAEADIHPDNWFLICHFVDDRVMPGTLMYECCAHTLRVFLQRMGWITDKPGCCYEPVVGVDAVLKCRGPVTPATTHVLYEVEISEIGYMPEPYVIADAHMYADGDRIVMFKNMSMKMSGITRDELETQNWKLETRNSAPLFDRNRILAFAVGKPSEAFGEPYKVFDEERIIARLPGPPYAFMDRVTYIEPEPWVLKPGGWIEAEYDIPPDEWYFKADRSGFMPFCVLLEIALQPCGWLAAYLGSALRSENNLKFRNLGGTAVLYENILPEPKTLTIRSRVTQVSESGGMIIENFDMQVLQSGKMIYEGDTYFGFFTKAALDQQVGIRGAKEKAYNPLPDELEKGRSYVFEDVTPLFPDDPSAELVTGLAMPAKALRMIDKVEIYVPDGGPAGLGFIRGIKQVDPDEWFFKAHFYQDPVCPGSLGIESFLQLMKFVAADRWAHLAETHKFEMVTDQKHEWIYRGQVIQRNKKVEVDVVVTEIQNQPVPTIYANGYLKVDGLFIYQMENFGLRLVPA
ncbi:beta-ketoacyl synthase N-terminal-like domain-containing protein [Desulfonema magnum]|uniref:Multi-domain beta-ketoacyl polyketide synthase n=1 Tax=Desulfonema magnum TaxID=45655 RepID=A0A975BVK0_9BACT|nr:beta-ketoacyl synthase N-terminal-like domain-containing protein [Desulfonema magnum]QTA92088.1 Putative multi-domain beta-ketoacyl polyketide synthase [Desulfonema magnum]